MLTGTGTFTEEDTGNGSATGAEPAHSLSSFGGTEEATIPSPPPAVTSWYGLWAVIDGIIHWLIEDLTWGGVFLGASLFLGTIIGSLLLVGVLLVKLPATYFQEFHSRDFWVDRHPLLRLTARSGKNVLGAIVVLVGMILALPGVPGQGVLTILVGLMLLDLPGKRRLERRIVGRPRVLRAINRLRKRFGSPPLVLGRRRGEVRKRLSHPVSGHDPGA